MPAPGTACSRRTTLGLLAGAAIAAMVPVHAIAQSAPQSTGEVDPDKLLEPSVLPEKALGDENAKVTIIEYASMTCGHCANFHNNIWPELKEQYIETGKVRFIVREFPFDPKAAAAFMLARCAPNDAYFPMIDVLFKQQDKWAFVQDSRQPLENIAKLAGFTQETFEACLTDQKLLDDINTVRTRGASEFGVDSTPTFFINGKKYPGVMSIEQFSAIIDPLLG